MLCILKVINCILKRGCCMRILVLGAGGVGGFLWQISREGEDVTFLVRSKRKTIRGKRTCNPC